MPIDDPIMPPTACNPAQPRIKPHLAKAGAAIKKAPIIMPATAADRIETRSTETLVNNSFLKHLLYPISFIVMSNTTVAAVNPRK
jgi:hypothetical protein